MNFSDFKPDKRKVLYSLLLTGLSVLVIGLSFFVFGWFIRFPPIPFYLPIMLLFSKPIFFSAIVFIFVIYPFGCHLAKNKKWVKGVIAYLIVFTIFSNGLCVAVIIYNNTVGRDCDKDSDCRFICDEGAVNGRYVPMHDPFMIVDCFGGISAFCKENKCVTSNPWSPASMEDCERAASRYVKSNCYYYLAQRLGDRNICRNIQTEDIELRWKCQNETG